MTFATISSFLSIGRPGLSLLVIAIRSSEVRASIQSLMSMVEDYRSVFEMPLSRTFCLRSSLSRSE
jgi:hypothetical protein